MPLLEFETVSSALSLVKDIYDFFAGNETRIILKRKDRFLCYNPSVQLRYYSGETPIALHMPYTEIADLTKKKYKISIQVIQGTFKLENGDSQWRQLADEGSVDLRRAKRVFQDEQTIRLNKLSFTGKNEIILHVQKAAYADQVRSNLVLDYPHGANTGQELRKKLTLRNLLAAKYDNRLPALNDKLLANTVGIACLVFYKHNGMWTPYFVRRTSKLAVFPKGIHCTASGVAVWPGKDEGSFTGFFTDHMFNELEEEVGLKKEDMSVFKPLTICREFTRGGKPQLFFAGITGLSRNELAKRRKKARRIIEHVKAWQEVEKDRWFRSSDVVFKSDEIQEKLYRSKVTTEAVAAFYYASAFIKKLVDEGKI